MKKKLVVIVLLILSIIVATYIGLNAYVDSLINKTTKEEEPINDIEITEDITPQAHEVVNFMLVGADNLDRVNGRENSYVEERSDVFKLTSLDRDIVVWIPDKDDVGRFNWAYSFGKAKYALNTINYNLDLDVSKYVSFSFKGFIDVIDIIGGVDIDLTREEVNYINTNCKPSTTMYEGTNHLNGKDALTYARIRYLDSDFVRMERQNIVIEAVIDKLKNSSIKELMEVVNKCLPSITTNLETDEIKDYLFDVLSFKLTDIKTYTYPKNGPDDVMWNHEGIGGYLIRSYSNQVIELHKFIYGTDTYEPTKRIYDTETKIYELYGEFEETGELLP